LTLPWLLALRLLSLSRPRVLLAVHPSVRLGLSPLGRSLALRSRHAPHPLGQSLAIQLARRLSERIAPGFCLLTLQTPLPWLFRLPLPFLLSFAGLLSLAGRLANRSLQPLHPLRQPILLAGATPRAVRFVAAAAWRLVRKPALGFGQLARLELHLAQRAPPVVGLLATHLLLEVTEPFERPAAPLRRLPGILTA
jgi:hypothetical protein